MCSFKESDCLWVFDCCVFEFNVEEVCGIFHEFGSELTAFVCEDKLGDVCVFQEQLRKDVGNGSCRDSSEWNCKEVFREDVDCCKDFRESV